MILKILDKKRDQKGNVEAGFVYIDDIVNIKVFWENSAKFGLTSELQVNHLSHGDIEGHVATINDTEYTYFVFKNGMLHPSVNLMNSNMIFVDVYNDYYERLLANKDVVYLAGAELYKRNGSTEYIIMDTKPLAFLMNDSGKTIEKLQRDV